MSQSSDGINSENRPSSIGSETSHATVIHRDLAQGQNHENESPNAENEGDKTTGWVHFDGERPQADNGSPPPAVPTSNSNTVSLSPPPSKAEIKEKIKHSTPKSELSDTPPEPRPPETRETPAQIEVSPIIEQRAGGSSNVQNEYRSQNGARNKVADVSTNDVVPKLSQDVGEGKYVNGKIITSILPDNKLLPWLVPAHFDPYKMPKALISDQLTVGSPGYFTPIAFFKWLKLPVEDYVTAMEMLTNDYRFRLYTVAYRRIIVMWLALAFILLLIFLFSGLRGPLIFAVVLFWFFLVAAGVVGCFMLKKLILRGLHHSVKQVNGTLLRHKLLVGVEDRGKLSCHKICIHFMYFDADACLDRIKTLVRQQEAASRATTIDGGSDLESGVIRPPPGEDVSGGQQAYEMHASKRLVLKHSQDYIKASLRRRLRFPTRPTQGVSEFQPLHCKTQQCLCQFLQKLYL